MPQMFVLLAIALAVVTIPRLRARPRPRLRRLRAVILTVLGLGLVVGGIFVAREVWYGLRPTPEFDVLSEQPDPSLVGTVAYVEGAQQCVRRPPTSNSRHPPTEIPRPQRGGDRASDVGGE